MMIERVLPLRQLFDNTRTQRRIKSSIEKRAPIAQTLDIVSNLKAQDRMKTIASKPELIVPGHDALVFVKFPSKGRVATIR